MELYLLFGEAVKQLAAAGVSVARSLVGSYVTSIDMAGASISVSMLDEEAKSLWDAPVRTRRTAMGRLARQRSTVIASASETIQRGPSTATACAGAPVAIAEPSHLGGAGWLRFARNDGWR